MTKCICYIHVAVLEDILLETCKKAGLTKKTQIVPTVNSMSLKFHLAMRKWYEGNLLRVICYIKIGNYLYIYFLI